jgi:hypothetical protein
MLNFDFELFIKSCKAKKFDLSCYLELKKFIGQVIIMIKESWSHTGKSIIV